MPIYYPDILEQKSAPRTFSYGDKDVMLYALGIGLSADPLDARELAFTYERGLKWSPQRLLFWPPAAGPAGRSRPCRKECAAARSII